MKAMKIVLAALAALMVLGGIVSASDSTTIQATITEDISVSTQSALAWSLGQNALDNQKETSVDVAANGASVSNTWYLRATSSSHNLQTDDQTPVLLYNPLKISGGDISTAEAVKISTDVPGYNVLESAGVGKEVSTDVTFHQETDASHDAPDTYSAIITFTAGYT